MTKPRRGVYLLPNLFTTGTIFAGFYAIISATNMHFESAAIAIFIAMLLDGMDGRIARLTNTQSDFGMHYDSLADMISFGLAPAFIMYQWVFSQLQLDKLIWLGAFVYTAATALRLARFNTQVLSADRRFFQGLPSPISAATLVGLIWLGERYHLQEYSSILVFCFLLTLLLSMLMVSNIRYHSFKEIDLRGKIRFLTMLLVIPVFVLIAINPPLTLFCVAIAYVGAGPILTLFEVRKRRKRKK